MPEITSKAPAVPGRTSVVAPSPAPVPEATSVTQRVDTPVGTHVVRLQRALALVDEAKSTPTAARAVISGYYRFLNPMMTTEHLPRSHRPHPANSEHGTESGNKWVTYYFHLANAAKALQDAYRLDREQARVSDNAPPSIKASALAAFRKALDTLESRTVLLEHLAKIGPAEWALHGDDRTGYHLISKEEHGRLMRVAVVDAAREEAKRFAKY